MELWVSVTPNNTTEYPLHSHGVHEIIYYRSGCGRLQTECGDVPFERGTVIIVPPFVKHRSVSDGGFVNICAHAEDPVLDCADVLCGADNAEGDAGALAELLLRTFMGELGGKKSLSLSLYCAYRDVVMRLVAAERNGIAENIRRAAADNIGNPLFDVTEYMANSGFAPDYARALFKARFGVPPVKYINMLRISYARNLMDMYGDKLKLGEVAALCGFNDPLYFSRVFKKLTGVSPREYSGKRDE